MTIQHKEIVAPADLMKALSDNKAAYDRFNALAPSHKNEYVKWIGEAKKEETRQKRIRKTIDMLTAKDK